MRAAAVLRPAVLPRITGHSGELASCRRPFESTAHADVSNILGPKRHSGLEAIGSDAIGIGHPSVAAMKRMLGRS